MPSDQGLRFNDPNGVEDQGKQAIKNNKKKQRSGFVRLGRAFILRRKILSCLLSAAFSASSRHMGLNGAVNRASRRHGRAILRRD